MSSPLEGRIRNIVRDELASTGQPPVAGSVEEGSLEQQVRDLHEHLHEAMTKISKLEYRLEFIEQGAQVLERVDVAAKESAPRRTRRKSAEQ